MKRLVMVFVAVIALCGILRPIPAMCADSDIAAMEARLAQLEREVADLKQVLGEKKAEKPAAAPGVEFSGKAYLTYEFDTNGSGADSNSLPNKGDSEFRIDRWYFTAKKKMTDTVGLTMTTDVRTTTDSGRLDVFFKNAYIDVKGVLGGTLVLGQQGTPWIGNEEKAWKYRVVRQTISDERSLLTSADFGIGLKGEIDGKNGDYHLLFSNGEGYGKREEGLNSEATKNANGKDLTARVSYRLGPQAPRISLYGDLGSASGADSNRWGVLLDQQIHLFSYGASYLSAKDNTTKKNAFSIYGNYDFDKSPWSLFARYDSYDPSKSANSDKRSAVIAGMAYKFDKTMMLTVSGHIDKDQTPGTEKDMTVKAALEVNY